MPSGGMGSYARPSVRQSCPGTGKNASSDRFTEADSLASSRTEAVLDLEILEDRLGSRNPRQSGG